MILMILRALSGLALAVTWAAGLAAPPCLIHSAAAQMQTREGIALQNQILQLQRQVEILQQQISSGAAAHPGYSGYGQPVYPSGAPAPNSGIVTQLLTRVDTLEGAVRELRGKVEQLDNEVQQQNAELSKRIEDLRFALQNPQTGAPVPQGSPGPVPPASARPPAPSRGPVTPPPPAPVGARRTSGTILQDGNAALARHDYAAAEQDAREVLANRASPRAYDAQFLLAQALMGNRQFSQAAIAYDDVYNRSKHGAHAADSLLGLADALVAINEKRASCDTLTKLRTEFPSARADLSDRIARTANRAGCR